MTTELVNAAPSAISFLRLQPASPRPFRVELDRLRELVSDRVVERGIADFRENRVVELDWGARQIRAAVEGSPLERPYDVEIGLDDDAGVTVDCACARDWEPFCQHAVATLLAYEAEQPVEPARVDAARDEALIARLRWGHNEMLVEPLQVVEGYGTWRARSSAGGPSPGPFHRVQIRSLTEQVNHCTCPDFAVSRLGTCKHLEAVLQRVRLNEGVNAKRSTTSPVLPTFVVLSWDGPAAPHVAVRYAPNAPPEVRRLLGRHFDSSGKLRGALPDAFHELLDEAGRRDEVQIGDDAVAHVRRIAEDGARRERREVILRSIEQAGNQVPGVRAKLYPFQVDGAAFLASQGRALLADDTGLGKTLQAIAAASWLFRTDVRRALVVCPSCADRHWAREVKNLTGLPVRVVEGPPEERAALYRSTAPFTITTYEQVAHDVSVINEELSPDLLIVDDAHRVPDWRTETGDAIKAIASRYVFVLAGTGFENRLEDLFGLMQLIDPRMLGPLWRYLRDFQVVDDQNRIIGYRNLPELRRRLVPAVLRRDRRLVRHQLPDRVTLRLDVPLSPHQRHLQHETLAIAQRIVRLGRQRPLTPSEERRLLGALQRTRMVCSAAGLVDNCTAGAPKLRELAALLETFCLQQGRKVVVFSEWQRMTAMAARVARQLGLGVIRLRGGVRTRRQDQLSNAFNTDPTAQVVVGTDAAATGLDLEAASVVINLDLPLDPSVSQLRLARVCSRGTDEVVHVVVMTSRDSFEQHLASLVARNREHFVNVRTDETTGDVTGLSRRAIALLAEAIAPAAPDDDAVGPADPAEVGHSDDAGAGDAVAPLASKSPRSVGGEAGFRASPSNPFERAPTLVEPVAGRSRSVVEESLGDDARAAEGPANNMSDDEAYRSALCRAREILGPRLERAFTTDEGLVVVVDSVDELAESASRRASNGVRVSVVDNEAFQRLAALGPASPWSTARPVPVEPAASAAEGRPGLIVQAERHLVSAEVLIANGCVADGLELAARAMLAALSSRDERPQPVATEQAAVWLQAEALARGVASADEVTTVMSALALSQTGAFSQQLASDVLDKARRLVTRCPPSGPQGDSAN